LTLTVWRIANHKHLKSAFTGEGARLYGGRWNSPGTPMIYTAQSQSLAILEMLVHLDSPELLKKYVLFGVEIDAALVTPLDRSSLPKDWKADVVPASVQALGDAWATSLNSVALRVPSTLVPDESNFLLNPLHPNFPRLRIRKPITFQFDPRFAAKRR
jgi:RES domain-containing protein